jgi:hypothetical protein
MSSCYQRQLVIPRWSKFVLIDRQNRRIADLSTLRTVIVVIILQQRRESLLLRVLLLLHHGFSPYTLVPSSPFPSQTLLLLARGLATSTPALVALLDEESLFLHVAQDALPCHLFAEPPEQAIL